jgi:hypothetical protein
MILFHSKVWPAFESVLTIWGPFRRVDVLTGFLGSGALKVVKEFGNASVRIVFGLNLKNPALPKTQIEELKATKKVAKLNEEGGTPLNNSVGMKGDRTIRKGICGDQPPLTFPGIGEFPGYSHQPSRNRPGWGRLCRTKGRGHCS